MNEPRQQLFASPILTQDKNRQHGWRDPFGQIESGLKLWAVSNNGIAWPGLRQGLAEVGDVLFEGKPLPRPLDDSQQYVRVNRFGQKIIRAVFNRLEHDMSVASARHDNHFCSGLV